MGCGYGYLIRMAEPPLGPCFRDSFGGGGEGGEKYGAGRKVHTHEHMRLRGLYALVDRTCYAVMLCRQPTASGGRGDFCPLLASRLRRRTTEAAHHARPVCPIQPRLSICLPICLSAYLPAHEWVAVELPMEREYENVINHNTLIYNTATFHSPRRQLHAYAVSAFLDALLCTHPQCPSGLLKPRPCITVPIQGCPRTRLSP